MPVGREYVQLWGIPLNPGRLTESITYQRKSVTGENSFGEDVYSWVDLQVMRADVRNLAGKELQSAQQRFAEAQYQIIQHYVAGLQRKDRIAWLKDGAYRYLDVLDIQDRVGTGRQQEVLAKEWTA